MMASRMRSAVESYAKAHNISNEQATRSWHPEVRELLPGCMEMLMLNGGLNLKFLVLVVAQVSEVVVGQVLTGAMMMRIRPAVVHGPVMMRSS